MTNFSSLEPAYNYMIISSIFEAVFSVYHYMSILEPVFSAYYYIINFSGLETSVALFFSVLFFYLFWNMDSTFDSFVITEPIPRF